MKAHVCFLLEENISSLSDVNAAEANGYYSVLNLQDEECPVQDYRAWCCLQFLYISMEKPTCTNLQLMLNWAVLYTGESTAKQGRGSSGKQKHAEKFEDRCSKAVPELC